MRDGADATPIVSGFDGSTNTKSEPISVPQDGMLNVYQIISNVIVPDRHIYPVLFRTYIGGYNVCTVEVPGFERQPDVRSEVWVPVKKGDQIRFGNEGNRDREVNCFCTIRLQLFPWIK